MSELDHSISWLQMRHIVLPLKAPISDAKVLTGRQKPLVGVDLLCVDVETRDGGRGFGYSYTLRAGGPALYAHAVEIAPLLLGECADDVGRLWDKLLWAGISAGRGGVTGQTIAAFDTALWDLKAKRAGMSLAKLLGAHHTSLPCYNTSGGYLQAPMEELLDNMAKAKANGIGGIKMKIGQPDSSIDLKRVEAARRVLGDGFPLMVDVNQQWNRSTAKRIGRALDDYRLTWLEEPLASDDVEGHAALARQISTPISTGEMLTSVREHTEFVKRGAVDILQPDAPRVGGVTPFLKILAFADQYGLEITPHFVMEIHIHLAASYPREPWVEHFEWFEPLFEERLEIVDGRMLVPTRPGIGVTLGERADGWTVGRSEIGARG